MRSTSQLYIEVLCTQDVEREEYESVQQKVRTWIKNNFSRLQLDSGLDHADNIQYVQVADCYPPHEPKSYVAVNEVDLTVHCLRFEDECRIFELAATDGHDVSSAPTNTIKLPCMAHNGLWEGLHYAGGFKSLLLNKILGLWDLFRDGRLNATLHNYNRLVLLYGPPGSGKTTLCRALAQKLAIRQSSIYGAVYLIEINANAFHSKFFGESGKEIAKVFQRIADLAGDPDNMVCVLIDEVETIASSRSRAHATSEVGDALRATNQLLTALDKMRLYTNVIMFTTSNLADVIDEAFTSRVDIVEKIPSPSSSARYEILRSSLNDLHVCKKIVNGGGQQAGTEPRSTQSVLTLGDYVLEVEEMFPRRALALADAVARPEGPVAKLLVISQKCDGFSGRLLRRLTTLAIATRASAGPVLVMDALTALNQVVDEHKCSTMEVIVLPDGLAE